MDPNDWTLTGNPIPDATSFLGTTTNEPLIIKTNGAERLRIDSTGKVGIGTPGPASTLHLYTSSDVTNGLRIENTNSGGSAFSELQLKGASHEYHIGVAGSTNATLGNKLYFYDATGGGTRMVIDTNGNVGIGTPTPDAPLTVAGWISTGGGIKFSDGSMQTTASIQGPPGTQGTAGPPGPPGPPVHTVAVCGSIGCAQACNNSVVASQSGPCTITSETGPCPAAAGEWCCVCAP